MADLPAGLVAALADRYMLKRELGRGGNATVYLAYDPKHDRKVALKVLLPELALSVRVERFLREIQIAAKLTHPHILPLYDSGAAEGILYYVMPFVEGESLRDRLQREPQLPLADALQIAREVADALSYAHQHDVVHRDIKPENILLQAGHAVVADFGIARALSEASGQTVTQTGIAVGTPVYMSPEQSAGSKTLDGRSDVYSLGCVVYEMLAGRPPFAGESAQEILAHHALDPVPTLRNWRADVPPGVAAAIGIALAKRPAERFATAAEFAAALTEPEESARLRVRTRRARARGLGAAFATAVVLAGAAFALASLRGPRVAAAGSRSIAVLPFETLGGADTSESLADGLQDDILTQLTKIGALQVTSRRSVQDYRRTTKSVREIGRELGVRALLTGQVQRAGDRVHINVQLIEAGSDRQVWAEAYDRELTAEHVFAIQDSIAKNVAEALRIELSPAEARAIAETPTENLEALDYFHRGRELFNRRGYALADTEAPRAFERAVALDPRFAQAWAGLAQARSWLIRQYLADDTTPARRALDRAEALAPDAPETELARGFYQYYAKGEYAAALEHFRAVERARPSDGGAVAAVGNIMRRQGNWRGALERGLRMTELDPRDPSWLWDLGGTYLWLRRFADGDRALERALILYPDYESARIFLFAGRFSSGDTARAGVVAREAEGHVNPWTGAWMHSEMALLRRDYPRVIRVMAESHPINPPQRRSRLLLLALANHAAGQTRATAVYADSVRQDAEAEVRRLAGWRDVFGGLADLHGYLGLAHALLGHKEAAVKEGQIAVGLNPPTRDAIEGPRSVAQLAAIYVLVGDHDSALERLRYLNTILSTHWRPGPSLSTSGVLRLDPLYDPLRGDPRFETVVREAAAREREGTP